MLQTHFKNSEHLCLEKETVLNIINLLYVKDKIKLSHRMELLENEAGWTTSWNFPENSLFKFKWAK